MKNVSQKVNEIAEYLSSYKQKVSLLNKLGLFDEAKHFELFAIQIAELWFKEKFKNCNETRSNEPYVDLCSLDETKYIQVSTTSDSVTKIKQTLKKIKQSEGNKIRQLFFILLNDFSREKLILDETYDFFDKDNNILTIDSICRKTEESVEFCNELYDLIHKDFINLEDELNNYQKALEKSKYDISQIKSTIGENYHIDVSERIKEIKSKRSKNNLVLGVAGVGKTAFCKELLQNEVCLFARAELFEEKTNIDEIWGFDVDLIFSFLGDRRLFVFIDSLESISETYKRNNLLGFFLEKCQAIPNVFVVLTCRRCDSNAFFELEQQYNIAPFDINSISIEKLREIKTQLHMLNSISSNISEEMLCNPWYLDMLLKLSDSSGECQTERQLRDRIWEEIVCKDRTGKCKTTDRRNVVSEIIRKRSTERSVYVYKDTFDLEVLKSLISDDILIESQDKRQVRVKYDIFEDIWFERKLDEILDICKRDSRTFFSEIEKYNECIYRRYQIWISNKLRENDGIGLLSDTILFDPNTPPIWRDRTIIGIVKALGTASFFEKTENELVKHKDYLEKFIDTACLYAFQIDHKNPDPLTLIPVGDARRALITVIYKNKLYKEKRFKDRSIQLIRDYRNTINLNSDNTDAECKDILVSIIMEKLSNIDEHDYDNSILTSHLSLLYSFAKISEKEIGAIWDQAKQWLESSEEEKSRCGESIIQAALSFGNVELCIHMADALCELADYYWRYESTHPPKDAEMLYIDTHEWEEAASWGLSMEHGRHGYSHQENLFLQRCFVYPMLQINPFRATQFIVSFLNKSVEVFNSKHPDELKNYIININGLPKAYWGCEAFWTVYRGGAIFSQLFHDLLMDLEYYVTKGIEQYDSNIRSILLNNIVNCILNDSNNIMPLPILLSIATKYGDDIKECALPLSTNMDFVLFDLSRTVYEPQFVSLNCMGMHSSWQSKILTEFNKQSFRKESLQEYVLKLQFDTHLRTRINGILDELYESIKGLDDYPVRLLNIQKMDLRKQEIAIEKDGIIAETKATDEAKKVIEDNEKKLAPIIEFAKRISDLLLEFKNNPNCQIEKLEDFLKEVFALDRTIIVTYNLNVYIRVLVLLALSKKETTQKTREHCVDYMLSFLNELLRESRLFVPGMEGIFKRIHIFEEADYYALWMQIDSEISEEYRIKIKMILIEIITQGEQHIVLSDGIRDFLKTHKQLEQDLKRIWIELIKEETKERMDHFVHHRMESYHFEFEKCFADLCRNVPVYIDLSVFDMKYVDVNRCFALCNFNLSVDAPDDLSILKVLLQWVTKYYGSYDDHRIDYFSTLSLAECLYRNLLIDQLHADAVIELLISSAQSKTNHYVKEFYEKIFSSLVGVYFDAYKDTEYRKKLYGIWDKLDQSIGANEKLKSIFYNCLIFTKPKGSGSWDQLKTAYSSEDVKYINEKIVAYGKYNLEQVIYNIFGLKSAELLPNILFSLGEIIHNRSAEQNGDLHKSKYYVVSICRKAFTLYKDEIRKDVKLDGAYRTILNALVDLRFPEAAILLDCYNMY